MSELDELDRLAAEKVMGWNIEDGAWVTILRTASQPMPSQFHYHWHEWTPTDDIAQAWLLWQRLYDSREYCCMTINMPYLTLAKQSILAAFEYDNFSVKKAEIVSIRL